MAQRRAPPGLCPRVRCPVPGRPVAGLGRRLAPARPRPLWVDVAM